MPDFVMTHAELRVFYKMLIQPPELVRLSEEEQRTMDRLRDRAVRAVECGQPD